MLDSETRRVHQTFCDRTLPKIEWTHEAHLRVCLATLSTMATDDAVVFLRHGISAYNAATGVENTPTSGYHETLTVYYTRTIADLRATTIEQVLVSPRVSTASPLSHWSRSVLFSAAARARWVEPDLVDLPVAAAIDSPGSSDDDEHVDRSRGEGAMSRPREPAEVSDHLRRAEPGSRDGRMTSPSSRRPRASGQVEPGVDVEQLAGDERGSIAQQERHRLGDV